LSDEFLEGPDTNCPAGHWLGLAPVDLEAERKEAEEHRLEVERLKVKPILALALDAMVTDAAKADFLVAAVGRALVSQTVAKEAAEEGGIDLDAEPA